MLQIVDFGITRNGQAVHRFVLSNGAGMEVEVSDFGACILAIRVPDLRGGKTDVLLGFDTLAEYEENTVNFGAFIGRNANRIANARTVIDGVTYELEANRGPHNLHSGSNKSHLKVYAARWGEDYVEFSRLSPHMEQGFPGDLSQTIRYTLTEEGTLRICYEAVSDQTTIINLTNHSHFNLSGHDSGPIYDQVLSIEADAYLPTDETLVPTGEIRAVKGTAMDLRQPKALGPVLEAADPQIRLAGGIDHNFNLRWDRTLKQAARLCSPRSGISMEIWTDLCGVQIYTCNLLDHRRGKGGTYYERHCGICFETQYYPNACNEPAFPSPIFPAGTAYQSVTEYRFSTEAPL